MCLGKGEVKLRGPASGKSPQGDTVFPPGPLSPSTYGGTWCPKGIAGYNLPHAQTYPGAKKKPTASQSVPRCLVEC